jgi:peptidoglycan/LPS O-acetylase OafA/YrhL
MHIKKIEQLDALRFFAVLAVLITHWNILDSYNKASFLFGANGVNLFFALSGFLITLILINTKEQVDFSLGKSLRNFYIRRTLRIFPIYYLMLIALWFFNHIKVADGMPWYLCYLTNFYCIKIQNWGGLSHLWSLSLEEQFYLVWPIVILLIPSKKLWIPILLIIIISICAKVILRQNGASFWILYMSPISVLDILGLGSLLAYFYYFHIDKLTKLLHNTPIAVIVFVQFIICIYVLYTSHFDYTYLLLGRFSFGLVSIWIIGRSALGFTGLVGKLLLLKPIKYAGKISYGIYLFHILVPGMLMGIKSPSNVFVRFVIYFIVTIAISSFSWFFFERRILRLKEKFEQ